jgi:hypothetical protein
MPKFDKTYCSQCGGEFGPGDSGYSHCDQHITEQTQGSDLYSPTVKSVMRKFDEALDRRRSRRQ